MDVLSDFILFSFSIKILDGCHDVIIVVFSKSISIFLKFCIKIPPGVHTDIMLISHCSKIQYGRHFDFSRKFVMNSPPEP